MFNASDAAELSQNRESRQTTKPMTPQDEGIFKQKVFPKLSSILSTSSGLVSNLIGLAGGLWEKKPIEVDSVRSSSYSSSIIFDESPDILIVSKQKVYGRRERFSQEFAINLKKLRNGRYSEYMPRKNLDLNVDSDVQPQIVTLRDSYNEQRKRTESCYPRLGHQKSNQELFSLSENKDQSVNTNESQASNENPLMITESAEIVHEKFRTGFTFAPGKVKRRESLEASEEELEGCKTHDFERSAIEEEPRVSVSCIEEIHKDKKHEDFSRCRSLDSVSVTINGKIFRYFDKAQLCSIPVVSFEEFCTKLKALPGPDRNLWDQGPMCPGLCCFKRSQLEDSELADLERLIQLALTDFDPCNDFHLTLLLGTYIQVTGEKDWPGHDKDWLRLGFSSIDLKSELAQGGLLGLFFIFFLSCSFPTFLQELIKVSTYYSFEVFEVLKQFMKDSIILLRSHKLNCCMNQSEKSIERFFLFASGMVKKWFKLIVLNKDFSEMHKKVISEARSAPIQFIHMTEDV